ncbi:hypothetical protein DFJ77DRAFT_216988 [Powellomyces hirtus]|nr:hypothetical protein DFJ77DRAFT_216988 [Powellomyces hirtus]
MKISRGLAASDRVSGKGNSPSLTFTPLRPRVRALPCVPRHRDEVCAGRPDRVQRCLHAREDALGALFERDPYYAEFAELGVESLRRRFGFSNEFLAVLEKVFVARVGVAELRKLAASVQFFFAPIDESDNEDNDEMRISPALAPVPAPAVLTPVSLPSLSWADDDGEMDYDDVPVFTTPKQCVPTAHELQVAKIEPQQLVLAAATTATAPPPTTPVPSRRARQTATATELVRNTIAALQCFLAGVGDKVAFDRGVVYVVGG